MAFNQSVYKHDYKSPSTFIFAGLEKKFESGGSCFCIRKAVDDQPCHLPPYISGKLQLTIPKEESQMVSKFDCEYPIHGQDFKVLSSCHPEIFKEVQNFSPEELKLFLTKHRMSSVYKNDYCRNKTRFIIKSETKRPDPDFDTAAIRKELMKIIHSRKVKPKRFDLSDCAEFANAGRPFKEKSKVVGCENHRTEYMDGISKLGCIITKNNIHSHVRCFPKLCNHDMNAKKCRFKSRWV